MAANMLPAYRICFLKWSIQENWVKTKVSKEEGMLRISGRRHYKTFVLSGILVGAVGSLKPRFVQVFDDGAHCDEMLELRDVRSQLFFAVRGRCGGKSIASFARDFLPTFLRSWAVARHHRPQVCVFVVAWSNLGTKQHRFCFSIFLLCFPATWMRKSGNSVTLLCKVIRSQRSVALARSTKLSAARLSSSASNRVPGANASVAPRSSFVSMAAHSRDWVTGGVSDLLRRHLRSSGCNADALQSAHAPIDHVCVTWSKCVVCKQRRHIPTTLMHCDCCPTVPIRVHVCDCQ